MESTSLVAHATPLGEIHRPASGQQLLGVFLRTFDRSAREVLEIARAPFLRTMALALSGLALVVIASVIASLPMSLRLRALAWRPETLRPLLEALSVMVPGLVTFSAYLRLKITPRRILAAMAIGLLFAGVLAFSVIPLVGFLAAMSRSTHELNALLPMLPTTIAFGTTVMVPTRLLLQFDSSGRSRWLLRLFLFIALFVFAQRAYAHAALAAGWR